MPTHASSHPHPVPPPPQAQSNVWFATTLGLAGLIVGYVVGASFTPGTLGGTRVQQAANPAAASAPAEPPATPPKVGKGVTLGSPNAKVTLVEFTDFQCPFCARHYTQTFGQLKTNYIDTGKLKYEMRHFPLGMHPNAKKASEAFACAADSGRAWQMHAKIFENQPIWSSFSSEEAIKTFKQYAKDVGADLAKFDTCIDSGSKGTGIDTDQAEGAAAGIEGTPGFWLIGPGGKSKLISGAVPYSVFQSEIDAMLK